MHHRPGCYRRLATAVDAFVGVRPAPQERCASVATGRTDKPLRPTPLEQARRTARLVRKARLKLSQRSRLATQCPLALAADRQRTAFLYYILTNLGQRDEPSVRNKARMIILKLIPLKQFLSERRTSHRERGIGKAYRHCTAGTTC